MPHKNYHPPGHDPTQIEYRPPRSGFGCFVLIGLAGAALLFLFVASTLHTASADLEIPTVAVLPSTTTTATATITYTPSSTPSGTPTPPTATPTPSITPTGSATYTPQIASVAVHTLNVRQAATTASQRIAQVYRGNQLLVMGQNSGGDWWYVNYGTGEGWVAAEYADLQGDPASIPLAEVELAANSSGAAGGSHPAPAAPSAQTGVKLPPDASGGQSGSWTIQTGVSLPNSSGAPSTGGSIQLPDNYSNNGLPTPTRPVLIIILTATPSPTLEVTHATPTATSTQTITATQTSTQTPTTAETTPTAPPATETASRSSYR
jgi:uncharacterized protein YgiM (DUF1202 family)